MRLRATSLAAALAAGLVLVGGCADVTTPRVETTERAPLPPNDSVPSVHSFPPAPDQAVAGIYERSSLTSAGHQSRYVLMEDHTFELQYLSGNGNFFSYHGFYARSGRTIDLRFVARSRAGPWEATGTLDDHEDRLRVEYDVVMMLSDFDDGVYLRVD